MVGEPVERVFRRRGAAPVARRDALAPGQVAQERAAQGRGTFTFRAELLDAASLLDAETFAAEAAPLIAMR